VTGRPAVLVVGDVLVDVVVRPDGPLQPGSDTAASTALAGGGSAANTAAWLADAGVPVVLAGAVGDDALGAGARADLVAVGVDDGGLAVVAGVATGTCVVLVAPDGERTMLPDRAANEHLTRADVDRAWAVAGGPRAPSRLHLAGYTLIHPGSRAAGRHALDRARAEGVPTSIDASSAAPLRAMGAAAFLDAAGPVDLLFANDVELDALGGEAVALSSCAAIVVKHGAGGATWTDGRTRLDVAAAPTEVVDTTGAGDALSAGYLSAAVAGADPGAALEAGVVLAARAVASVGARPT